MPIFKRFRLRFSYFQKPDDDGLKMAEPDMSDSEMLLSELLSHEMLRSQSSSASLRESLQTAVLAAVFDTGQHSNRHPRVHRAHDAQGLRQGCRTG